MGIGKSTLYSILPPGTRYRELWLPEAINSHATLPSSIAGGHPLALTGARKGTTVDGVHFTGAIDSDINCGAIHNAAPKFWRSFWFKLDEDFAAGSGTQYLCTKVVDGTHRADVYLNDTNGTITFYLRDAGGPIVLASVETSWSAGVWYHVIASLSDAEGERLIVSGGTPVTNASLLVPLPNGANLTIGNYSILGAIGFKGVIRDVFFGTDDLTEAEETDLYKGIPPADVVNEYLLDEGRGVTAYDRGPGADNGALDTAATWAWGSCKQPVISLDGINDFGQSSAGVDISGASTLVWAGKMKSTYDGLLAGASRFMVVLYIDDNDSIRLYFNAVLDQLIFRVEGSNIFEYIPYDGKPAIDDYWVIIGVADASGNIRLYVNGLLVGTNTGVGAIAGGAATAYIGAYTGPTLYDISKPLFVTLIDGAFTERQARGFSRTLNDILGLGLRI